MLERLKQVAGKIINLFSAKKLLPYVMKEKDLQPAYVAEHAGTDLGDTEMVVNAWKAVVQPNHVLDKTFGAALMAELNKAAQAAETAAQLSIMDILGEAQAAAVSATPTAPTAGAIPFEARVRGHLLREAARTGIDTRGMKGALESKVKRAGFELEAGRLRDEPTALVEWAAEQMSRLDVQAMVRERLEAMGYQVQAYVRPGDQPWETDLAGGKINFIDYAAVCHAVNETETDDPEAAVKYFISEVWQIPARGGSPAQAGKPGGGVLD